MPSKIIHFETIARLRGLDSKLFDAEDTDYVDGRVVGILERAKEHWLDKDGITDSGLRLEALQNCRWENPDSIDVLRSLGWECLAGLAGSNIKAQKEGK